jgi:hypothetical protein
VGNITRNGILCGGNADLSRTDKINTRGIMGAEERIVRAVDSS